MKHKMRRYLRPSALKLPEQFYRPSEHHQCIRVYQRCSHPVSPEDFSEIDAIGSRAIFAQLRPPPAPKNRSEQKRRNLTAEISPNRPTRRPGRVVPNKSSRPHERQSERSENPIGQLAPVDLLHP